MEHISWLPHFPDWIAICFHGYELFLIRSKQSMHNDNYYTFCNSSIQENSKITFDKFKWRANIYDPQLQQKCMLQAKQQYTHN